MDSTKQIAERLVYRWRNQFSIANDIQMKILVALFEQALQDERDGKGKLDFPEYLEKNMNPE